MLWRQVYRSSLLVSSSIPSPSSKNVPKTVQNRHLSAVPLLKTRDAMKQTVAGDQEIDPVQEALLNEVCILVDKNDRNIGSATKKECHLLQNGLCKLHRAFSVFLFNQKGELLLQQRSDAKITFPDMFTNTCCSHPLATDEEMEEKNVSGVRKAARRKLEHELGISTGQIELDDFQYLTRIQYSAASDGIWGEHEVDYILFIQKDVKMEMNLNEVKSVRYVTPADLRQMIEDDKAGKLKLTPWFRLICKGQLFDWWKNLASLKKFEDHSVIHKL